MHYEVFSKLPQLESQNIEYHVQVKQVRVKTYSEDLKYCRSMEFLFTAQEIKEKEEAYEHARNNYSNFVDAINSQHPKDLFIGLTFRGLLSFMYSVYEYSLERIESKKGKQDQEMKEKMKEIKRTKRTPEGFNRENP
jgi:hypothetical protein